MKIYIQENKKHQVKALRQTSQKLTHCLGRAVVTRSLNCS